MSCAAPTTVGARDRVVSRAGTGVCVGSGEGVWVNVAFGVDVWVGEGVYVDEGSGEGVYVDEGSGEGVCAGVGSGVGVCAGVGSGEGMCAGVGSGVGVCVGVGSGVGVCVGVGSGVGVGVGVGFGVGVCVGVGSGVGVCVGVGSGVGVGVGSAIPQLLTSCASRKVGDQLETGLPCSRILAVRVTLSRSGHSRPQVDLPATVMRDLLFCMNLSGTSMTSRWSLPTLRSSRVKFCPGRPSTVSFSLASYACLESLTTQNGGSGLTDWMVAG